MNNLFKYFSTANDIINLPTQTTARRSKLENGKQLSTSTPKSKNKTLNSRTPRSKKKLSPKSSPLEGFNKLFKSILKQSPEYKKTNSEMDDTDTIEITDSNSNFSEDSIALCDDSECSNSSKVKINAFQVLMESRNKVIGSNSQGKATLQEDSQNKSSPPNLSARKRLLQTWSDSINSKKRKLNDVEIDKCIKGKLNKRKERLKTLLNIEDDQSIEATNTPKSKSSKYLSRKGKNCEDNSNRLCEEKSVKDIDTAVEKLELKISLNNESMCAEHISTPRTSKIRRDNKIVEESLNNTFTPKSRWKMKIKLISDNLDDDKDKDGGSSNESDVIILNDDQFNSGNTIESKVEDSEIELLNLLSPEVEITEVEDSNQYKRVLRNRTSLNRNQITDYMYASEDSDDEVEQKRNHKAAKVAPVFTKAKPKPKIDPEVLEARRKFLMSDMPDVLKKKFDKQMSNIQNVDIDFDVFPKISHIYQKDKNNLLWNLPSTNLKMRPETALVFESENLLCRSLIDRSIIKRSRYEDSIPIENTKKIIRELKESNSNYPVYKAFRLLSEKNGVKTERTPHKTATKKGRKQRNSSEMKEEASESSDSHSQFEMWTEKYKPTSSEDFFSNSHAVSAIKRWLEKWKEILESGKRRKKRYSDDSDSEFMSSDAESVYDRSILTTLVLAGPCGSGKSSSVYAICKELGLSVLEVNASSRRTGKNILQELQEATQSHQVRKNKGALDAFTNRGQSTKSKREEENGKLRRMCVLLIEDIDIVFDQDEGFISAISQISSISKRPIILTTTNEDSVYSQKFISEFKTIRFQSSSVQRLGVWLQILCVLEGIFVDLPSICEMLEYNRGDIRKTLLELQYWIQSGGQNNKNKTMWDPVFEIEKENCLSKVSDDASNLWQYDEKFEDYRVHTNILSDFEIFEIDKFYNIPKQIDLKTLWWNIPKFLYPAKPKPAIKSHDKYSKKKTKRLRMVSDMYDSVARYDLLYSKMGYRIDDPVCRKRWHCGLKDSLELDERISDFPMDDDILELNHYLTNGYLDMCKKKFIYEHYENQRLCNMAVPKLSEERRLENDHRYEDELLKPVPFLNSLDHKSVTLDYLPCLRTIARTENVRSKNNVKRHNRFYNYLQNLNINCDTAILDFAIQTFSAK